MKLYHASNVEVKHPMLVESNRMLDFGPGFYTTTNRDQVARFAKSVVVKRGGHPVLNMYEFDETGFDVCVLRRFEAATAEWLDFVAENRAGKYAGIKYDLIFGPVANDNVYSTVLLYLRGFMSREATIAELRVHKLYDQLVFVTPQSFRFLKFIGSEAL